MRWVGCTGGRQGSDTHRIWLSRRADERRTVGLTENPGRYPGPDPFPRPISEMCTVALASKTLQALPRHRRSHPFLTFPFPLFG